MRYSGQMNTLLRPSWRSVPGSGLGRTFVLGLALFAGMAAAQTAPITPATPPASAAPQDPGTVVARVGSEEITLGEFETQFRVYVGRIVNGQGMPFSESVLPYFNEYRPEILTQITRQRGLLQLARNAGLQTDTAQVEATIASNKEDFENDEQFAEALGQSGFNGEEQLRQIITDSLLANAYLESLLSKFTFSDAIVNGYYVTHRSDFQRAAQACVKHILVADEAAAKAAKARLDKQEAFAAVARDLSQDPGSKNEGGELGCFERGVTVPEFDRASFSGPVGALQQVKSQFGVHLLIVSSRNDAGMAPLAEVQADIRKTLANEAAQKYVNSQLTRLKLQTFADKVTLPTPERK